MTTATEITIPLVDLRAQYQTIKHEVLPAIERVLDGMQLYLGPEQLAFEREFAAYCGAAEGVCVADGTEALSLALRACAIGPGDEVITVSNTFIATIEAIMGVGATPVLVDVDPDTYTLDWRQLEAVRTPKTRAIIPVHLYGHPAEMGPMLDFARAHGLRVIEDASQAHGATYQGQRVGSFGDIGCFSLYCSKNLGAYGEAGICVTSDPELAETLRVLRDHGSRKRYEHELIGVNGRMDEIQAAVLRVKLPYLEQWNDARRAVAAAYSARLGSMVAALPVTREWAGHIYYVYVVQVDERDRVREELAQAGIATGVHYPIPIHLQPACASLGYARGSLPVTEAVTERILSLPMYAEMSGEQIDTVVRALERACVPVAATH
jgi:dTDP-4-amino-4,6-dideoxygalactose transaminase